MASTDAFTVVGGGDTGSALKKFGLGSRVDHLSTGGGASLEYIEKGDLPGLSALRESASRQRSLRASRACSCGRAGSQPPKPHQAKSGVTRLP